MYDPNIEFVRQLEIYKATNPETFLRVYFIFYDNSVEEQVIIRVTCKLGRDQIVTFTNISVTVLLESIIYCYGVTRSQPTGSGPSGSMLMTSDLLKFE